MHEGISNLSNLTEKQAHSVSYLLDVRREIGLPTVTEMDGTTVVITTTLPNGIIKVTRVADNGEFFSTY